MATDSKEAFEKTSLGAENKAYNIIAKLDPEYFEKLKGIYIDGTFGREGALPRRTKELIMTIQMRFEQLCGKHSRTTAIADCCVEGFFLILDVV